MTDTAQTATTPSTPAIDAPGGDIPTTLGGRASALADKLQAAARATEDASDEAQSAAPSEGATPTPAPSEDPKRAATAEDRKAAREARFAELREKERQRMAHREQERGSARVRELEAELSQLRQQAAVLGDLKDPQKFLQAAQTAGVDPIALAQWLQGEKPAAQQAAQDPRVEEALKRLEAIETASKQQQQQMTRAQAERNFLEAATEVAEQFPLVDAFRKKLGDSNLIALATSIGPHVPEGATMSDLIGLIEDHLDTLTSIRGEQATPKPNASSTAAAKANRHEDESDRSFIRPEDGPLTLKDRAELVAKRLSRAMR